MKTRERLVLQFLKAIINPLLDQFQFAYRNNKYVDDAAALGLLYVLKHLDSPDTYARIFFVDFSSAFNTIILSRRFDKIQSLGIPQSVCLWILDFLWNRPQVVKNRRQLIIISYVIYWHASGLYYVTNFTPDCLFCHVRIKILKFVDDITVIGLLTNSDESEYRDQVNKLISWCYEQQSGT